MDHKYETNCNQDYIGECPRRIEERIKDHNGRNKTWHILRYSIESGHNEVLESDFQIIGKAYGHHTQRRKIFECHLLKRKSHH